MGCHASKLRMDGQGGEGASAASASSSLVRTDVTHATAANRNGVAAQNPAAATVNAGVTPSSSSTSRAVGTQKPHPQQLQHETAVTISLGKAVTQEILTSRHALSRADLVSDDILPHYLKAAQRAVEYLSKRVLNDKWVAEHDDFGYYYKAPMAFLELGREADASKALAVAVRFLTGERTGVSKVSTCDKMYPQYPLLWIAWAAERLGVGPLADKCYDAIASFAHPVTGTGVTGAPYSKGKPFESSFFATALLAKSALLHGKLNAAVEAGDSLLRAVSANEGEMAEGRFCLRWTWSGGLVQEPSAFNQVLQEKGSEQQLHWMLAFPASVLIELAETIRMPNELPGNVQHSQASLKEKSTKFTNAASTLLGFLRACGDIGTNGHMVACAAAQAKDKQMATKLVDCILPTQFASGGFQPDPEALCTMDQAAEIAVCIQHVRRALANPHSSWPATNPLCPKRPGYQETQEQAAQHSRADDTGAVARSGVAPASAVQAPAEHLFARNQGGCADSATGDNAEGGFGLGRSALGSGISATQRGVGAGIAGTEEMAMDNLGGHGRPAVVITGSSNKGTIHTYEAESALIVPAQQGQHHHAGWLLGSCCAPSIDETML